MDDCGNSNEEQVILSLGSNLGDRFANIETAVESLGRSGLRVEKLSSFYETNPQGNQDQPDFINAAVAGTTSLDPHQLLELCKKIERELGRDHDAPRWSARTIDIDILFHGRNVVDIPELTIPHPRLRERLFALVPAIEAAPAFITPDGTPFQDFYRDIVLKNDFSDQIIALARSRC